MSYEKIAPDWKAKGIQPPTSKREVGWEVEDRPPAAWLNWFMNLTSETLQELQTKAAEKTYVTDKIAEAIAGIDVDIPDASLTKKGIAQLTNAVDSASEVLVPTAKAVKTVNDALVSHKADNAKHIPHLGTTTNVGNVYSITTTEVISTNQKFTVKINAASTAAATLKVSSIASGVAKALQKAGGTNATLKIGVYTVFWDGTAFQLLGEGGEYGNATAAQVLSPNTIGTENGIVTGTMPNRGVFNLALGANVLAGYYSGGTAPTGKKYASGTLTTSEDLKYFYRAGDGNFSAYNYITVSGLTFTPSTVLYIPTPSGYTFSGIYHESFLDSSYKVVKAGDTAFRITGNAYIDSTGFQFPVRSGVTGNYTWYAFE